jgi:Spy/CpxP family protein refolding chaperone
LTRTGTRWALPLVVALLLPAGRTAIGSPETREKRERDPYRELSLSGPQSERLAGLHARIDDQNRQLKRRLENRRDQLAEIYRRYDIEDRRERQLREEIQEIQEELLTLHHTFQVELRRILTPSQFDRLQQALREHGEQRREREEKGERRRERDRKEER